MTLGWAQNESASYCVNLLLPGPVLPKAPQEPFLVRIALDDPLKASFHEALG
jgi:hypothetical protein